VDRARFESAGAGERIGGLFTLTTANGDPYHHRARREYLTNIVEVFGLDNLPQVRALRASIAWAIRCSIEALCCAAGRYERTLRDSVDSNFGEE